jgi:YVTN family beta-propeller protein
MRTSTLLLAISCLLSAVSGQWLEDSIGVGDGPRGLCHNPQNHKVYCANQLSDDVTVIDAATNDVITTIPTADGALVLCYNPANNKVYCAGKNGDEVTVIDGASDSVIARVAAGDGPRPCATTRREDVPIPVEIERWRFPCPDGIIWQVG